MINHFGHNGLPIDSTLIKKQVKWRDLVHLTWQEKLIENTLFLPWLLISLALAYNDQFFLAGLFSLIYFLSALRQAHNGYHNALGIHKTLTALTLFINSGFMLASIHAVKFNHMKHHKHDLNHEDYEVKVAKMSWWKVLLYGVPHWIHLHKTALIEGDKKTKRIVLAELGFVLLIIGLAILGGSHLFLSHVVVITLAELCLPFFTVWIVHQGCDEHTLARTSRNKFINFITMNMLMHFEHHLFPAVPAIKMKELAKRIDLFILQNP